MLSELVCCDGLCSPAIVMLRTMLLYGCEPGLLGKLEKPSGT